MSRIVKVSIVLEVEVPDDSNWVTFDYNGNPKSWQDAPKKGGLVWCMKDQYGPPRGVEIKNWSNICFKV